MAKPQILFCETFDFLEGSPGVQLGAASEVRDDVRDLITILQTLKPMKPSKEDENLVHYITKFGHYNT